MLEFHEAVSSSYSQAHCSFLIETTCSLFPRDSILKFPFLLMVLLGIGTDVGQIPFSVSI